jgi:hypothetical protein
VSHCTNLLLLKISEHLSAMDLNGEMTNISDSIGDHIRKKRMDLKLLQSDVARFFRKY